MGFLPRDGLCRNPIPDEDSQKAEKERTVRQVGSDPGRAGPFVLRLKETCGCVGERMKLNEADSINSIMFY